MRLQRSSLEQPLESTNLGINPSPQETILKLHNKDRDAMENGRTTKLYYERFISLEMSMSRVVIINMCLLIIYVRIWPIQYEFDFLNSYKQIAQYDLIVKSVLYLVLGCTILVVPLNVFREMAKLELQYYQKNTFKIQFSIPRLIGLILQSILLMTQPYPFLNDITFVTKNFSDDSEFSFKLNYMLTLYSLLRLYAVFRALMNRTVYMNPRSNRLSKMYLCKADYHFALKCMFKDYPNKLIISAFLISILLFSFALRICERQLTLFGSMQPQYLSNQIWLTIITMTTVGYGDMFPCTSCGRIVCIILVIWGIFIVSIMVVVLTNTFQMDQRQLKVLSLMKKLEKKEDLRLAAVLIIQHLFKWAHNRGIGNEKTDAFHRKVTLQAFQRKRKKLRKNFVHISNQIKNICQEDDVYEEMSRQFHCLDDDLKSLNKNQQKMMDFIHEKIQNRSLKK